MKSGLKRLLRAGTGAAFLGMVAIVAKPLFAQPVVLYDVSYRWSASLPSIFAYKKQVTHVLGRRFTSRLAVVKWQSSYGLVYRRHGYFRSASKTALQHSKLLTRYGLSPAAVVVVHRWTPIAVPHARAAKIRIAVKARAPAPAPAVAPPVVKLQVQAGSSGLETAVSSYIDKLRQTGALRADERTAWSIYDLSSDTQLVGINDDMPFETASLVKPFVALAYFTEVSQGRKRYSSYARGRMQEMIQESDNAAADYFLRKMGGPARVSRLLKKDYGGLLTDLQLVEYIPYSGRTYRNKASARDYSRFLYALWKNQLPYSDEMKRLMNLPKPNRLYTGANELPRSTQVYDKTGTTSRLCGDMGILVIDHDGRDYPYIVVGIIQKSRPAHPYFAWMARRGDIIREVSNLAYEAIAARHGFGPALGAAVSPQMAGASATLSALAQRAPIRTLAAE